MNIYVFICKFILVSSLPTFELKCQSFQQATLLGAATSVPMVLNMSPAATYQQHLLHSSLQYNAVNPESG